MATAPYKLLTFAMSHYSEKIRWTLDHANIPYQEECLTPVFHMGPALRLGGHGKTTLPVLQTPGEAIQDSARILTWLNDHGLITSLMPPEHLAEVRAVEQRFNDIGKDVARLLYAKSFGKADAHIIELWTDHAPAWQARIIRLAYPLIRMGFKQKLRINEARALQAQARIDLAMHWLEDRIAHGHGRRELVGQQFTVADITAASLLAPIACPPQHPVYGDPEYRKAMAEATAPWKDRPAVAWVLATYEQHRGTLKGGVSW